MSRLTIDLGTAGNPATGDSIRTAFNKVNENFTELYAELGGDSLDTLSFTNNTISSGITNGTLVLQGNGTGAVDIEGIQVNDNQIITTTTNANLLLDGNGTGTVVINGLSLPTSDGTAGQVLKTDGAGNLSFTNVDPGAITIVGDDSTGTAVNIGETFKIAGTQNVSTAISGDTLTITGPDLSSYATTTYVDNKVSANNTLTIADDTSTTTSINLDNTLKVSGAGSISTSVTDNTLTITGTVTDLGDFTFSGNKLSTTSSNADMELDTAGTGNLVLKSGNFLPATDNTQYLGSADKRWHTLYVGPGSININGVTISESGGSIQIPGGFTGIQGLASIILPDPNNLPYGNQLDNLGAPFDFDTATIFYDHHTYLYIANKVASGGIWSGWTVGQSYPESLGFTPATFIHYSIGGALTQLVLLTGGSGLSNVATDNVMAFRPGDPITTVLATPYSGVLGTVNSQGTSQPSLTTTSTLTSGGTFTAQDESLFFDNINLQSNANIVFPDSTTQSTAASLIVVGDDSTGTTFNAGETIKIAGAGSVTTSVSGDTLTITGSASAQGLTFVGDDSTGTRVSDGETFKITGTQNITTAVSGDTLTITGPNLSSYLTNSTITVVGDDSTGTTLNTGETIKIAGTQNITTAVSGDTLTITGPDLSSYLTSVPSTIEVNEISSGDSSAIQINDAVNISGALTANVINIGNASSINFDGGTGSNYSAPTFADGTGTINKAGVYKSANNANNALFSFGANGAGVMSVVMDGSLFIGSALPSNNGGLNTNFGGWLVVQSGGKFGGDINTLGGLIFDDALTAKIQFPDGTLQTTARAMTIVGDDSTGTAVNIGETFKIAGTQNITTAVSGDTLTITGPSLTNYAQKSDTAITIVGDDSTGTAITIGETFKIQGAGSVTTSVSGDTITITGTGGGASIGDLTVTGSTITAPSNADLSLQPGGTGNVILGTVRLNGTTISSDDSTKITLAENVDITGALQVNEINSADSSAIQINDGVNVSGTLTANTFVTNTISSTESTAIQVNDGMNVTGTLTANTIQVNEISSTESSAIQVNDAINSSSTITATSFTTHGSGGSITGVNTLQVNEISSADSTAIQINDGVNVSGTLTANTLVTNNISSSESSAIQVDDAINFSGAGTFHGSVRFNAGYTEKVNGLTSSTTITVNCALASVHTVTLAVSTGFVISNLPTGGTVTLIITQGGSGSYTATFGTDTSTSVKFAGGAPTLSTAVGAIDVVTVFNDGTNYLGNIAKAYA